MRLNSSFVLLSLVLASCADSDYPSVGLPLRSQPVVVLDEHAVFVDPPQKRAYLLDLSQDRPKAETERIELPPAASATARRNGHNDALILCSGERENEQADAAEAALIVVGSDGRRREYELGTTAFNALAQSDDGRYAIAYRSGSTPGRTLDNPNEVSVIDLDVEPDAEGAVTPKTPAGLGHTLTRVLVSPTLTIAGEERRLLVLLSAAEVSVFDLGHLDRRATIVQLDERRSINPEQVLFSSDQPIFYVRATSSDNIFMFRFEPFDNPNPGGNDFQPSINPLSGGGQPRDMALFGSGSSERLLVLAGAQALVIDPATSKSSPVTLTAGADRILLFEGTSPQDGRPQMHALLYATSQRGLSFLDLETMGDTPSDSLELVNAEQPVERLIPLVDGDERNVVLLQSTLVTVVDLQARTLTPISTSTQLTDALFDPVRKKLWVGASGSPYIQSLELSTGRTGNELRLDAPIGSLLPMFQRDRLLVLHSESVGYLTLVDAERPDREHALSLRGYFVNDLFDRGEP
jgi:hypothetical protein